MSGPAGEGAEPKGERAEHKGVHWWRDEKGNVSFYDTDSAKWVRWTAGGDAPPLPPKWQMFGVATRATRPGWRSPRRIVPLVLIIAAVVVAVYQSLAPSGNNTAKERRASEALAGKCLSKNSHGFSSAPVPCSSKDAAVKVVSVITSTPGSPLCPAGTSAVELAYAGVRYPHVECVAPVAPGGG